MNAYRMTLAVFAVAVAAASAAHAQPVPSATGGSGPPIIGTPTVAATPSVQIRSTPSVRPLGTATEGPGRFPKPTFAQLDALRNAPVPTREAVSKALDGIALRLLAVDEARFRAKGLRPAPSPEAVERDVLPRAKGTSRPTAIASASSFAPTSPNASPLPTVAPTIVGYDDTDGRQTLRAPGHARLYGTFFNANNGLADIHVVLSTNVCGDLTLPILHAVRHRPSAPDTIDVALPRFSGKTNVAAQPGFYLMDSSDSAIAPPKYRSFR